MDDFTRFIAKTYHRVLLILFCWMERSIYLTDQRHPSVNLVLLLRSVHIDDSASSHGSFDLFRQRVIRREQARETMKQPSEIAR